ncbi:MAG: 3-hydroxyacyl-CoA dehydrogenase NAD-binding domain-containing protein, partial [Vibrio sp.]
LISGNSLGRKVIFEQAGKKAQAKARGNYPAIDAILKTIAHGLDKGMTAGLEMEASEFGQLVMTSESKSLRHIFFSSTAMKKDFGADATPQHIERVGVLGGGLMGAGIAYVSAVKAKKPVRIKDVSHEGVLGGFKYSHKLLLKAQKRGIYKPREVQYKMQALSGGVDYQGFDKIDFVAEAVFEDLDLKQSMVAEVEASSQAHTIFATNTSSIPIGDIAAKAQRPENVIGLHYFSPVDKMPLVEVIPHSTTSDQTIATTVKFARSQGKTPIVVQDQAGFYVNRILAPYMNEAARILLQGEPIEKIDNALLDFGFPVGPITLLDEVGIDVGAKITPILVDAFGPRFEAPDVFQVLLDDGRKGRKSNKGFYLYPSKPKKSAKKEVDTSVYDLLNITQDPQLDEAKIAKRCVFMMLNEAVRALDDGIIASARDGDVGAIYGIGFPPFLGGPFHYMDSIGLENLVEQMNQFATEYGDQFAPCDGILTRAGNQSRFYS